MRHASLSWFRWTVVRCFALVAALASTAGADVLDPLDFSSLGSLHLSGGSFTIDTDALTIVDDAAPGVSLFTGVLDDQRGLADSFGPGGDVTTVGPMGVPHIAVFTFDGITLQSGAAITVTGHRALALLSKGSALVDTTIDVSGGAAGPTTPFPAGTGRAGGFDGGYGGADGLGPGGGEAPASENIGGPTGAAGGSFGSQGAIGNFFSGAAAQPGPTYGDLSNLLQGGSGGGGVHGMLPAADVGGGAGGGALEIGAAEALVVGPNGQLIASGGAGIRQTVSGSVRREGGGGSGGGIRLHGAFFDSAGQILATGAPPAGGVGDGGGGRVLIYGINATLAVGEDLPDLSPYGIDVNSDDGGGGGGVDSGVIVVSPELTIVPAGQSLELGGPPVVVQEASTTQPRIELIYHGDVRADRGAELIVPSGGFINANRIELGGGSARITGGDSLTNVTRGELRGSGSVEVELINDAGGQVNATNDSLTFTQAVTNNAGAQINAINSTLNFDAGLTNDGDMNLINTTVNGAVNSSSNIALAGTSTFTGDVSGPGDFPGGGAAVFAGSYSPGNSAALIQFGGDVTLGPGNTLAMELGGITPGSEHDALHIAGDAVLGGMLSVALIDGFSLGAGQEFMILDVAGILAGEFDGLAEGELVDDYGGTELFITYASGDGNDVALFTGGLTFSADFDEDGDVDGDDLAEWQGDFGENDFSDADGDADSDGADFLAWQQQLGSVPAHAATAAVPEPASMSFLLTASLAFLLRGFRPRAV